MTAAELRALRAKLGWTQEQLANAVGRKTDRVVHLWESGAVPVPQYAVTILTAMTTGRRLPAPKKRP